MSWDETWDNIFKNRGWGKYPSEDLIRFIARSFYSVESRESIKILEIGSGTGANLWYMAREGFSVYGIEGSASGVEQSIARLDLECPNWQGKIQQGDIIDIPYPDNFFDAIIDSEAISCNSMEDAKSIVNEATRVLKQGGAFFSKTFATGCYGENSGEKAGYNARYCKDGPLGNVGLVRFTSREDIELIFSEVTIQEVNLLSRTIDNQQHEIKEWIIHAVK